VREGLRRGAPSSCQVSQRSSAPAGGDPALIRGMAPGAAFVGAVAGCFTNRRLATTSPRRNAAAAIRFVYNLQQAAAQEVWLQSHLIDVPRNPPTHVRCDSRGPRQTPATEPSLPFFSVEQACWGSAVAH